MYSHCTRVAGMNTGKLFTFAIRIKEKQNKNQDPSPAKLAWA